ncbi:MAG: NAD-dependent DNA ligase [Opitutaceae bacterium]|nr:NAD-dependent DNA ligase [Opitutaceae bacterium]
MSRDPDSQIYRLFTGRQNSDKAMQTLDGILQGVVLDGIVNLEERNELRTWLVKHVDERNQHPSLNEAITLVERVLADDDVTASEIEELRLFCSDRRHLTEYYDEATHVMQRLHGLLHGIISDGHISDEEVSGLEQWLEENFGFRQFWPVSEIETLIVKAMNDRCLDAAERAEITEHLKQFTQLDAGSSDGSEKLRTVGGICATDPEIIFLGSVFCITGRSERAPRKEFINQIERRGGLCQAAVGPNTKYLIICAEGNSCWAYAGYGRKVEQAMRIREAGQPLVIVHERDFWDAVVE